MIEPTFDLKKAFFDRKAVTDAVDAGTRKAMVKSLAAFRNRLIAQFQFGDKPSKPGQSPRVRSRNRYANLRNVQFAYDAKTQTGVAGSIRLPKSKSAVPGILEHGGTVTIPGRLRRNGSRTRPLTIRIAKRPAASVALTKSVRSGEIIVPYRNSVRGN
jgi:hypothetical protein